jgi:hypothetical protein
MKTGLLAATLAAATVVLVGCKDSTGGDNTPIAAGSLAFSYTGARSGTYSTSGAVAERSGGGFVKQQFATAVKFNDPGQSSIGVISYFPVSTSTGDEVIFAFPSSGVGQTSVLTDNCNTTGCALGLIVFDTNPDLQEDSSEPFFLTTGTLQVSAISGGRITGTFRGTAEDLAGVQTITVTNGTFDLPLIDQSRFPSLDRSAPTTPILQRLRGSLAPR